MSNVKHAALAALSIALLPAASLAAGPGAMAAHACAEAFVAGLATPEKPAPKIKAASFYGIDDLLGSPSQLELTAYNPRTGQAVARASCELSATGKVLAVKAVPL
ncbi:MAG TPA: hypothetical protein VMT49_00255 [Steroidobacteraceae bacterium]|nr:hypothetical protein [Steroidobacteraceae bacterium]